jgi:hypothetical protein
MSETPYARLRIDLSGSKVLPGLGAFPWVDLFGGGGFSFHFATPLLSQGLVGDVLVEQLGSELDIVSLQERFTRERITRAAVEEVIDQLSRPAFGVHLVGGFMLGPRGFPFKAMGELKFLIPFTQIDPCENLGGFGFVFNTGAVVVF